MTGNNENGLYETKEDKIFNLIQAIKKFNTEMLETENERLIIGLSNKITNIEKQLLGLGLTYAEIENAMYA